jgi:hypothetical protein
LEAKIVFDDSGQGRNRLGFKEKRVDGIVLVGPPGIDLINGRRLNQKEREMKKDKKKKSTRGNKGFSFIDGIDPHWSWLNKTFGADRGEELHWN